MVKIGPTTLLDIDGQSLVSVLKLYPTMYNKSTDLCRNLYGSGQMVIPIQYLLMEDNPLVTCHFDEDLTVEYISKYDAKCYCYGFKITKTAYDRYCGTDVEIPMWQYLIINQSNCNRISLDYPICMSDILVNIPNQKDLKVKLEGVDLLNQHHPLIEYTANIITEDNTYYYLTQLNNTAQIGSPFGGFILGNQSTELTFSSTDSINESTCDHVHVLIRFKSLLLSALRKSKWEYRRVGGSYDHTHYYPLTKKSDNHYIEGYWCIGVVVKIMMIHYPFLNPLILQSIVNL